MPSGRMVKPENMPSPKKNSDYYQFIVNDIQVNIEKKLLNGKSEIEFLIITFGRYKISKENGTLRIV